MFVELIENLELQELTVVVVLFAIIVSLLRGWLVVGYQYEDIKQERNAWRQIALVGTRTADEALSIAEKKDTK